MTSNTHTQQKKQLYRWIGLVIGLILGLVGSFSYYQWTKKTAVIHFHKNIGESEFQTELQKWQMKNPQQAVILATEIQKVLGIYEELRGETNPEIIQQRALQRMQEMNKKEQEKAFKEVMEVYQTYAPSFLEKIDKKFPWYLRYYWIIVILITLSSSGIGFLIGYFLEPEQEIKQNYPQEVL